MLRENWVVPPGLESFFSLFPALKRWAKFGRPSGSGFSRRMNRPGANAILFVMLEGCGKSNRKRKEHTSSAKARRILNGIVARVNSCPSRLPTPNARQVPLD